MTLKALSIMLHCNDDVTMLMGILKALQSKDCNYQAIAKNATGLARKSETKEYLDKVAEV
jgi:hypothetical protein